MINDMFDQNKTIETNYYNDDLNYINVATRNIIIFKA